MQNSITVIQNDFIQRCCRYDINNLPAQGKYIYHQRIYEPSQLKYRALRSTS